MTAMDLREITDFNAPDFHEIERILNAVLTIC